MLAACGKPMNIMALISILHLSSGGVALAADTGRIIIRNDLAACVDMRVEKPPFEYPNGSNIVAINANFAAKADRRMWVHVGTGKICQQRE